MFINKELRSSSQKEQILMASMSSVLAYFTVMALRRETYRAHSWFASVGLAVVESR